MLEAENAIDREARAKLSIVCIKIRCLYESLIFWNFQGLLTIKDRREGWTDARSAVGFCLGSGLFGSYNSD